MEQLLDSLTASISSFASGIWNIMVPVLFGVGLLLTIRIGFLQFRKLGVALRITLSKRSRAKSKREGDITPFAALSTALAATLGNGNIAGVATALFAGGPGAIFWMWICGLLGMATKYSEAMLGVKYRRKHPDGTIAGGPMYYIRAGLNDSKISKLLAAAFAVCGAVAAFGIGNMVQSNQMSHVVEAEFGIPGYVNGLIITIFAGLVILGGIKRIGAVASRLVPGMVVVYFVFGAVVLIVNITAIPQAFMLIFEHAFTPISATGGFLGATVKGAVQFGARRGIFSNEAGLGSAPIAHAAAQTPGPIYQGLIGVAEAFIDTIVVCTFTALIILTTGAWTSGLDGTAMTAAAFSQGIPIVGGAVVAMASLLFGFSTLIGWSYYGEQCLKYLFGIRITSFYRMVFTALIFVGAVISLDLVFAFADVANAFMAFPNLVGLLLLSGLVAKITREALEKDPLLSE
ncbi:MAG: sodium:alanine symporter family protein [Candidatus Aminicenantes bacterium]